MGILLAGKVSNEKKVGEKKSLKNWANGRMLLNFVSDEIQINVETIFKLIKANT